MPGVRSGRAGGCELCVGVMLPPPPLPLSVSGMCGGWSEGIAGLGALQQWQRRRSGRAAQTIAYSIPYSVLCPLAAAALRRPTPPRPHTGPPPHKLPADQQTLAPVPQLHPLLHTHTDLHSLTAAGRKKKQKKAGRFRVMRGSKSISLPFHSKSKTFFEKC